MAGNNTIPPNGQVPFATPQAKPQPHNQPPKKPASDGFGPATKVQLSQHATQILGGGITNPHKQPKS